MSLFTALASLLCLMLALGKSQTNSLSCAIQGQLPGPHLVCARPTDPGEFLT